MNSPAAQASSPATRPPAVLHVDLDGLTDISAVHGWQSRAADDPIFESGIRNVLAFLERNRLSATFFVIASSLDDSRKRDLLREIMSHGHDVASHSLTHPRDLHRLGREAKRREIAESRERLERTLGVTIRGFRAPGYLVDRECLELLAEYGYEYDASVFPTKVFEERLQVPASMLTTPCRPLTNSALLELPLPDHRPSPVPFNPSYALLLGAAYFRWGLRRFHRRATPLVLLFHLIDLADPLPRERLNGRMARVYTLSNLSAESKRAKCQRMIDMVLNLYRMTTTASLIDEWRDRLEPQRLASAS